MMVFFMQRNVLGEERYVIALGVAPNPYVLIFSDLAEKIPDRSSGDSR
jgi:hypothetical protein